MFALCPELPALSEESLFGLCLSLNSPVIHSDDLPLGPARAAIALHRAGSDGMRLTVALRSLDAATLALFEYDAPLAEADGVRENIGIALSFGESLGFLFDDELIASDAAASREALNRWFELVGESPAEAQLAPEAELLLDDEVQSSREVQRVSAPLLSKFRRVLEVPRRLSAASAAFRESAASGMPETREAEPIPQVQRKPAILNRLLACFWAQG